MENVVLSNLSTTAATTHMQPLSTWNAWKTDFKIFILINLNLSVHIWLVSIVLDSTILWWLLKAIKDDAQSVEQEPERKENHEVTDLR